MPSRSSPPAARPCSWAGSGCAARSARRSPPASISASSPSPPRWHWRRHATGWAFTAPALAILAAFLLYPIGYSLWLSLHEWDGYTAHWGAFVGIENYRALAEDEVFWRATVNSIVFVIVRTPL